MRSPLQMVHPVILPDVKTHVPEELLVPGAEASLHMLPVAQQITARFPHLKDRPVLVALIHGTAEDLRTR